MWRGRNGMWSGAWAGLLFAAVLLARAPGAHNAAYAGDRENTLKVGGSGGALPVMQAMADEFSRQNPGVRVHFVPSLGSGGGIKALLTGSLDLALISRPLTDEERGKDIVAFEYGRTPFVFVTARETRGLGLSLRQIGSVYRGETRTWPDGKPLRLILRPEGESDMQTLKSLSPEIGDAVRSAFSREGMITAVTDQESADTIEEIPGALGTSTLAQISAEKRRLHPLPIEGVLPSPTTLANGTYPYSKSFFLVARKQAVPFVRRFMDFVTSAEGRRVLVRTGHVVPDRRP